jgi:cytochrome c
LPICLGIFFFCSGCEQPRQERVDQAGIQSAKIQSRVGTDTTGWPASFGFGHPASPERIAAWDIDIRPDGAGLPPGQGTVADGEAVYAQQCAACHGATGTEGPDSRLVARVPDDGFPFGESWETWKDKTIGSYWPYATTLWDYIHRAMPQHAPGSLTPDEVYALTAFLLHRNEIIPEDAVMNAETLPRIEMPARARFVVDDRLGYQEVR